MWGYASFKGHHCPKKEMNKDWKSLNQDYTNHLDNNKGSRIEIMGYSYKSK